MTNSEDSTATDVIGYESMRKHVTIEDLSSMGFLCLDYGAEFFNRHLRNLDRAFSLYPGSKAGFHQVWWDAPPLSIQPDLMYFSMGGGMPSPEHVLYKGDFSKLISIPDFRLVNEPTYYPDGSIGYKPIFATFDLIFHEEKLICQALHSDPINIAAEFKDRSYPATPRQYQFTLGKNISAFSGEIQTFSQFNSVPISQ